MSKLIPVSNRLIVKRLDADDKSKGGIILPDNAKEKPHKGKVVAVGPGTFSEELSAKYGEPRYYPMPAQPGDVVYFGKWRDEEIDVEGEKFLVLQDSDVLAILK